MRFLQRLGPLFLAALAGVVLAAALGYKVLRERATAIENARSQTSTLAGVLEEHARQTLHRVRNHLLETDETLRKLRASDESDPSVVRAQLIDLLPADRLIRAFLVLDTNGAVVLSTDAPGAGTGTGADVERDYFKPHVRGADRDLVFGAPEKDPTDGSWSLPVSRRIAMPDGAWGGVIVAKVQPTYFQRFYDSIDRGPSGFITLFLTSGWAAVTSPANERVVQTNWSDSPLFSEHMPNWPTGTVRQVVVRDDVDRIYSYRVLNDYPVVVSYGLETSAVLAAWREMAWRDGVFLLLSLVALGSAAAALMRHDRRRRAIESTLSESQERYRELVESSPIGIAVHRNGTILYVNRAAVSLVGAATAGDLIGRPLMDRVHPDSRALALQRVAAAAMHGRAEPLVEERFVRMDGGVIEVEVQNTPILFEGAPAIRVSVHDITARKQAERRQKHQQRILQMLINKAPLADILQTIVRDVEAENPALLCSILLLDQDGKHLRLGAAPSLPDAYNQAIDGLAIGRGVGSCGTAAATGERVIVEDIASHPYWTAFLDITGPAGLAACWSQPILSGGGKILGTFAMYNRQPCGPTPADLVKIDEESLLAALVIEKSSDQSSLQLAANVFTYAREAITITDADGNIVEVNDTFSQMTGYSREEAVGRKRSILRSNLHSPEFYASLWHDLTTEGHWNGEIWNRRKNGDIYAEMLTISAVRDSAGKILNYVALSSDITSIKEQQRQLEHIAHFDALTGLPNRVLLADRLKQAMLQSHRRKQSLAVAYLDLDGFKAVNDQHGHAVGDDLLIALAQRMKAALRDGDTLARFGGDEFVAVLVDLAPAMDGNTVLQRLLKSASDPIQIGHHLLQVSASIGVTFSPQDGSDADLLIRHADQAMYAAKHAGKNRYYLFDIASDAAVQSRREGLAQIQQALASREFVLFYQPKVNMTTGRVFGAEALIRWQHPTRGLLPPAAFLPLIDDNPISIAVGEWVITTALTQMQEWRKHGLDLQVSVNIGAHQLQQAGFAERLGELLALHADALPERLQLEVLETSALEDIAKVGALMNTCRAMGVSFALDDFGTGYASLSYVKHLPAEVLKIDQSFVRDMREDPGDLAIVNGVIGLAKAFDRQVIAEGVETSAHGNLLLSIGCEMAQGYGIARPMPAADLPDWVARWHTKAVWTA